MKVIKIISKKSNKNCSLHSLYGRQFSILYRYYERQAEAGSIKLTKQINSVDLWRKMLTMLFETGHPWLTFKDVCNIRSPQQHVGTVHSSNLCCITADQRVVTDRGMLTIAELYQQGGANKVVGLDGVYDASEMLLPRPDAPILEIQTQQGYRHKVTPDHKVWVQDQGWVEAQHLRLGDHLLIQQLEGLWGSKNNQNLAYSMGMMAAESQVNNVNMHLEQNLNQATVSCLLAGNTALQSAVFIDPVSNKTVVQQAEIQTALATEGFNAETATQIPALVWQGNKATVSSYLRGLYQQQAYLQINADQVIISLVAADLSFIENLQIIWANFGVKTFINHLHGSDTDSDQYWQQSQYRLCISSVAACQIAEQVIQLSATVKSTDRPAYQQYLQQQACPQAMYAVFSGCKRLANEDAYCLMVDSKTHAWTVNGLITKNTEITLNTSAEEIAVCNLASVNLPAHVTAKGLDLDKLKRTVTTAIRMLDNVIDINYYAVPEARTANMRHRAIGLGMMGFQDALQKQRIAYESKAAIEFADSTMEAISYFAISASSELALERGAYSTFQGSLWDQGILPIDSLKLLAEERGNYLQTNYTTRLDWDSLRKKVQKDGMRNSNCMAIAPTATISNICGVSQSIEPAYRNLYVKSNLSGEFTIINAYLVEDLKGLNLWDETMLNDLKYFDGSIQDIDRVPDDLKALYSTAFEVNAHWLIDAAARRQKWIDQAQSLNLYMLEPSGQRLDALYKHAWLSGLKTTYYLRSQGATTIQRHRHDEAERFVSEPKACIIDDPECESCQ